MELSDATEKTPATPGIDPGTFRLVAQCLNHYADPGPQYTAQKITFYKSKNSPPIAFRLLFLGFCLASSLSSPEAWAGRVPWTFRDVHFCPLPPINVVTLTISHSSFLLHASHIEWNAFSDPNNDSHFQTTEMWKKTLLNRTVYWIL
jgi:hypothetical protein